MGYNSYLQSKKILYLRAGLVCVLLFALHMLFHTVLPETIDGVSRFAMEFITSMVTSIVALPCLWWLLFKPVLVTPLLTEAQQKLQQSETRFRTLTDFAPVGIFEADAQGEYIFVNQKWSALTGLSNDQARGRGWCSAIYPEDKQRVEEEWHWAVTDGWDFMLEYRVQIPGNSDKWLYCSATPIKGIGGETCSIMGIVTDVTERYLTESALRESEVRFRTIFQESEDAILLLVPGGCTIIDVNGTAEQMYGYTRQEMVGCDFNLFKQEPECDNCQLSLCQISGQDICTIDHAVLFKNDGSEIHVSVRAKVIKLQGEDAIFCTMRDISLRLGLEEESRAMQARMIHANKMNSLGLLVAGIAHEINNPNNYIMVSAQMLYRIWDDLGPLLKEEAQQKGDFVLGGLPYSQLEESLPEMIAAINDGSRRIKGIVSALKNYSRKGKAAMEALEIKNVVVASMMLLKHHVKKYTDNFVVEFEEGTPRILGSSQQLEQVVINLVMNALQSLTDRQQTLTLKTSFSAEKGEVLLTVSDEGCGIPDEVRNMILEPFFTTRLDSGGTGLGLSISRSIVLAHQGTIDISSRLGEGTVVTVSFPPLEECQEGEHRNE